MTGAAYPNTTLMVAGGTGPSVWASQHALPPGLTLSLAGVVKGTPTTSDAQVAIKVLSLTVQ
jgi:hypothetical protein